MHGGMEPLIEIMLPMSNKLNLLKKRPFSYYCDNHNEHLSVTLPADGSG